MRHDDVPPYVYWVMRNARPLFISSMIVLAVFCAFLPQLRFNFNLRSLLASNLRSFELDAVTDEIIGYSQTPVVLLTNTFADEQVVSDQLRDRMKTNGENSTIKFVASSADLVPLAQADKQALILRMQKIVKRIDRDKLSDDDKAKYDRYVNMVNAAPFARADLPLEVRRQFQGIDETRESGFVLAYPTRDMSDGAFTRTFAKEIRGIKLNDGTEVLAAGEALLLSDIVEMVSNEAGPVLLFAIGLVFMSLWLFIGSFKSAVACIVPAAGSLLCTLGCMLLAGLSLNYINVVMIPLFFGIGIDGGAHLLSAAWMPVSLLPQCSRSRVAPLPACSSPTPWVSWRWLSRTTPA